MIRIFRKIRQKLMTGNKTSKYLLYSIGEILLVVIGILIALWINTESQNYQNRKLAKTFLVDFKRDLEADIETLEENILKNEEKIRNADSIMIALPNRITHSQKENNTFLGWVNSLMGETYSVPEKTTIRQFESSSSSQLITSKTLKDQLFSYYTANDVNENNFEKSIQLYQHNYLTKDLMKVHKYSAQVYSSPDINSQQYSDGFELVTAIMFKKDLTTNQNKQYRKFQGIAEDLIKLINSELE
jgi:hypothetical protein